MVDVGMQHADLGYDRRITSYPNYKITDASIVNISSEPMRRAMVKAGADLRHGSRKDETPGAGDTAGHPCEDQGFRKSSVRNLAWTSRTTGRAWSSRSTTTSRSRATS